MGLPKPKQKSSVDPRSPESATLREGEGRIFVTAGLLQFALLAAMASICCAQQTEPRHAATISEHNLTLLETIRVPSETAGVLLGPFRCDSSGNIYLMTADQGVFGVKKISSVGKRLAVFEPTTAPGFSQVDVVGRFSIDPDGNVYQIVLTRDVARFVIVYGPDGRYKSTIKLQTKFPFVPDFVAPFSDPNYILVSGSAEQGDPRKHPPRPFTGVFSSNGTLVKDVDLSDDQQIYNMAVDGDKRVVDPAAPYVNTAVSRGDIQPAEDGNLYLMRALNPPIIYAISLSGTVVKRFKVEGADAKLVPHSMQVSRGRIAIQFRDPVSHEQIFRVIDMEGHAIAEYREPMVDGHSSFGSAFVCYSSAEEKFTFATAGDDETLAFRIAGVK